MTINTQSLTDPLGFPSNEPLVFQTANPLDTGPLCSGKNESPLGSQPTLVLPADTGSETLTVQLWSLHRNLSRELERNKELLQ